MPWFYDPARSFEDNCASGPGEELASPPPALPEPSEPSTLWGIGVATPFGIPAGPLPTADYCAAAFQRGFDVNVYKTVRSRAVPAHPAPNILRVQADGDVSDATPVLLADDDTARACSISNSFGVPSPDPDQWQPDMARAAAGAGPGQLLIGSFQGTRDSDADGLVVDHVRTARLVAETGVKAMELNLSCPNEGSGALLCFDVAVVARIVRAVRDAIGDTPLVLKLAYFRDDQHLQALVDAVATDVDGLAAVNSLSARLVDSGGRPALRGTGREIAGVCGAGIAWAAEDMVRRLVGARERRGAAFTVIGVGGVHDVDGYRRLRSAGADAVMSATGALVDPGLGAAVRAAS